MKESTLNRYILLPAILVILFTVLFIGLLVFALWPTETPVISNPIDANTYAESSDIAAGRYLAMAAGCFVCHTAPGGKPFAGGLPIDTRIGTIYSLNITPDKRTGIGNFSLDDFNRAVRYGINREGITLYPVMPFPSFARMTDQDLRALYAYFMHEVEPVSIENRQSDAHWPMSLRWPLAVWRKIYAPSTAVIAINPKRYPNQQIARGAYWVQGPGHCGRCHTPRAAVTLHELSMDESQTSYLSGSANNAGNNAGRVAVNLRGNKGTGLGAWSSQQIVDHLKGTLASMGKPERDTFKHSARFLSDQDLQAIAAYLKTLPASPNINFNIAPNNGVANGMTQGQQ